MQPGERLGVRGKGEEEEINELKISIFKI